MIAALARVAAMAGSNETGTHQMNAAQFPQPKRTNIMTSDEAIALLKSGNITEWNRRRTNGEEIPSLAGTDLTEANLAGANLYGANLVEANLSKANLFESDLTGANLSKANLVEAKIARAMSIGANIAGANLFGTDLSGANLSGANLFGANLVGANLSKANLVGVYFFRANLTEANFSRAKLDYNSHALMAEVLRRDVGNSKRKRMIAGFVANSPELCWTGFAKLLKPGEVAWALEVIARTVVSPDQRLPKILADHIAKSRVLKQGDVPVLGPPRPVTESESESDPSNIPTTNTPEIVPRLVTPRALLETPPMFIEIVRDPNHVEQRWTIQEDGKILRFRLLLHAEKHVFAKGGRPIVKPSFTKTLAESGPSNISITNAPEIVP